MTSRLMAFVQDRAGCWLPATEFEQFGRQAWRTRISDARKRFEAVQDGTIENRIEVGHFAGCAKLFAADLEEDARCDCGGWRRSLYRYVPQREDPPAVSQAGHDVNRFDLR
jgi:hypothetical protein